MSETTENWDYCQIDYQVIDDGRDPGRGGHKLMWFQFRARADGPNGTFIAGRAEKVPLANMMGADAYAPQKNNVGHTNTLQNFLQQLQKEGWELLPGTGGDWWVRRLRRPSRAKQSLRQKIANLFKANR